TICISSITTFFTMSQYLKGVPDHLEPLFFAQLILQCLKRRRKEFNQLTAFHAYHVVVVLSVEDFFVVCMFFNPLHFLNEATFYEQRDGSVYRCLGDL